MFLDKKTNVIYSYGVCIDIYLTESWDWPSKLAKSTSFHIPTHAKTEVRKFEVGFWYLSKISALPQVGLEILILLVTLGPINVKIMLHNML